MTNSTGTDVTFKGAYNNRILREEKTYHAIASEKKKQIVIQPPLIAYIQKEAVA